MTLAGFILYKYIYDGKLNIDRYSVSKFAFLSFIGFCTMMIFVDGLYEELELDESGQPIKKTDTVVTYEDVSGPHYENAETKNATQYENVKLKSLFTIKDFL